MAHRDIVRDYNASCEPFNGLLRLIERQPAARLGLTVLSGEERASLCLTDTFKRETITRGSVWLRMWGQIQKTPPLFQSLRLGRHGSGDGPVDRRA